MYNLGDGRLYAEYKDKGNDEEKPVQGKIRIITGYTTQYIDAEFEKGIATGKWEYYEDNKLAEVTHYADGLMNGELTKYYSDGKVKDKTVMKNGKMNGTTTSYYQDGKVAHEKGYKDGEGDGPERKYDEEGNLTLEMTFKDGKQEGKSFQAIRSANATDYRITEYFKNGKKEGDYLEEYKDGTVKAKGKHIDGKKEGLWELFKADGARKGDAETYKNGVVIKRVSYFTDGKVKMEREYNEQGKQHGAEREYAYEGGELVNEKNFVNGKQVGKQVRLISSNNGQFREHSVYNEAGKKHGEFREVYIDKRGERTKGQYVDDKKHGKWIKRWYAGSTPGVHMEETYDNGRLIDSKEVPD